MPDTVIFGDSLREPAMRHEVPVAIHDPFLYVEVSDKRIVVTTALEAQRLSAHYGIEVHTIDEYGLRDLIQAGLRGHDAIHESYASAVPALGVTEAVVPDTIALGFAERLRRRGVTLTIDREHFVSRRRAKSDLELAGIRRAQKAAEAGMRTAVEMLRDRHRWPVTSEAIQASIVRTFADHGCVGETFVVSHGPQSANGHERGSGAVSLGEPILIDLGPRDIESGCFADMTRAFVCGDPPAELVVWYELVLRALRSATTDMGPAVPGRKLYDLTCDIFEQNGYQTNRSAGPGVRVMEGFTHALGHGVGLDLHEDHSSARFRRQRLWRAMSSPSSPDCNRQGFGGIRLEDLVRITADGCEILTDFPYELRL